MASFLSYGCWIWIRRRRRVLCDRDGQGPPHHRCIGLWWAEFFIFFFFSIRFSLSQLKSTHVSPSISSTLIKVHTNNKQPLNGSYTCWSPVVLARWTLIPDIECFFMLLLWFMCPMGLGGETHHYYCTSVDCIWCACMHGCSKKGRRLENLWIKK